MQFGRTPLADILDIKGFSLDSVLEIEPGFLDEDHHEHDDDVRSFVFTSVDPLDQTRLQAAFRDIVAEHAQDLMRYKGIVSVAGLDHRLVFQGVHMMMSSDIGQPWTNDELRASKLVFIGRRLPQDRILARLADCRIG